MITVENENAGLVIKVSKSDFGGLTVDQGDDMIYVHPDDIELFVAVVRVVASEIRCEVHADCEDVEPDDSEDSREGAVDIMVDPEGCFVKLEQGPNSISIMSKEHAQSIAESLLMLVREMDGEEV
jgi:hypothetical protein